MQRPSLGEHGLSAGTAAKADRRQKRFQTCASWLGGVAGAAAGLLVGAYIFETTPGALIGAALGAGFGYNLLPEWLDPILLRFAPDVRQYRAFCLAKAQFDSWETRTREHFWRSLSGHRFERELATVLGRHGYRVTVTPGSGDHGVDLYLERSGRTTIVQCKKTNAPAGPAIARELYGALMATRADEGILASMSGATPGVHRFFADKPLRVMELDEILRLQRDVPE